MDPKQVTMDEISNKNGEHQKNEKCQIINCKFLVECDKKRQDLEDMLSLSKKKEIEFAKDNERLSAKVEKLMQENKNQEERLAGYKVQLTDRSNFSQELVNNQLLLDSEKKKYQELEEVSKNKEIELTKKSEVLNAKVKSLMEENKNQEEQLTEYKEKWAVVSSPDKNNSSQKLTIAISLN